MKLRNVFSALLVLCMVITLLPFSASAAEVLYQGSCGASMTWTLDEDGTLTISGSGSFYNTMYDSVNRPWNAYADSITALVVEEGVTDSLPSFSEYTNLVSVTLPSTLEEIPGYTFALCTALTEVNLSEGLTTIGSNAFEGCTALTEVHLPASVSNLGAKPFSDCASLTGIWAAEDSAYFASDSYGVLFNKTMTELVEAPSALAGSYGIPETVSSIRWGAFWGCKKLTAVTVPEGVTVIPFAAFQSCTALESVQLPDSLMIIDMQAFYQCTGLWQITIPANTFYIELNAFAECASLKKITIPASVLSISSEAFYNCTALEVITFEGDAPGLGYLCFENVTATAYYPADNDTWTEEVTQECGGNITWVPYESVPVTFGDLNDDGEIDLLDANLIVSYYNGTVDLTEEQLLAADLNGNGEIDLLAANLIVACYNGTIDSFPIE